LYAAGPEDVSVLDEVFDVDSVDTDDDALDTKDTLTILTEYIDAVATMKPEIAARKTEIVNAMRSLYLEAVEINSGADA
jgi:hypothetical protein